MGIGILLNKFLHPLGLTLVRRSPLESMQAEGTAIQTLVERESEASEVQATRKTGRLQLANAVNQPPQRCTGHAPATTPQDGKLLANIIEFRKNGVTVVGTDPSIAHSFSESENFNRDVGNLHSSWDWAGNAVKPYSTSIQSGIPSDQLRRYLKELFSGEDFQIFFRSVLGCDVTVGNCRLVKSSPHAAQGIGPQSWHQDGCPPGIIRGVLYLTDVDEHTGPFQYKDDQGGEHTVLGKTGDLLIFDAMRLEHRAMPPTQRVRKAIDLVFMPRMPSQNLEILVAGMNHWPADPFAFREPTEKADIRERAVVR